MKLIKVSEAKTNSLGNNIVEFCDEENKCLGCAMCATRCPDLAIVEVIKD
jgi:Pyruvate/2-oxoacid:ferredoxin oxidoreductase delta subunit